MRILGTICARGGSKGIKNKNIRFLFGKPLIAHSINALKAWGKTNRIICSTDSKEIKKVALDYGAEIPFIRPSELATDKADKHSVLQHALKFCEEEEGKKYDFIVDLDPTSPLRTVKDIEESFNKLINNSEADVIFSVYKAHKNPYFNMVEIDKNGFANLSKRPKNIITARQFAPKVYSMNASIYVYRHRYLIEKPNLFSGKNIMHLMPDLTIDIDRELDFEFIEYILKKSLFKFDY